MGMSKMNHTWYQNKLDFQLFCHDLLLIIDAYHCYLLQTSFRVVNKQCSLFSVVPLIMSLFIWHLHSLTWQLFMLRGLAGEPSYWLHCFKSQRSITMTKWLPFFPSKSRSKCCYSWLLYSWLGPLMQTIGRMILSCNAFLHGIEFQGYIDDKS